MAAFGAGSNKEYLVRVIAVLSVIKQKGTEQDVRKAFQVLVEVRREMKPLFELPDGGRRSPEGIQTVPLLRPWQVANAMGQVVHEMHSKGLWIGMNGKSNQGLCLCYWLSFQDCIELRKLTIFPADATEKQHFYMQQTIKKPRQVTIRQYMARMGILNDYLAFLPMV
jgi:hypothetical protein